MRHAVLVLPKAVYDYSDAGGVTRHGHGDDFELHATPVHPDGTRSLSAKAARTSARVARTALVSPPHGATPYSPLSDSSSDSRSSRDVSAFDHVTVPLIRLGVAV